MVNFYGKPKAQTKFRGKTVGDLIRAKDKLEEIRESVGLTEEEEEALKIAEQCIVKVAEQLKM